MSELADQAAAAEIASMLGIEDNDEAPAEETVDEQPEAAVAPEAQETAEETETEAEPVNLDPRVPEDLEEYLNEPDFEDDEEEPEPVLEVPEEEGEYEDEEVVKLRKQLSKETKRREHAEKLRSEAQRSNWAKEAVKYFPLSEHLLSSINATSRRGFLREARKAHEAVKPYVSRYIEDAKKEALAAKEAARAEGRQEAVDAWGRPLVGPGNVPMEASAKKEALESARATGNLTKVVKELLKQGRQI